MCYTFIFNYICWFLKWLKLHFAAEHYLSPWALQYLQSINRTDSFTPPMVHRCVVDHHTILLLTKQWWLWISIALISVDLTVLEIFGKVLKALQMTWWLYTICMVDISPLYVLAVSVSCIAHVHHVVPHCRFPSCLLYLSRRHPETSGRVFYLSTYRSQ